MREKDDISIYYDPMIAKLVVWGEDRISAIRTLSASLRDYRVFNHQNYRLSDYQTTLIF